MSGYAPRAELQASFAAGLAASATVVDPAETRDLRPAACDAFGRPRVMPGAFWAGTTPHERALFGHRTASYCLPTVELVDLITGIIDGRPALEIGAGNGVLAEALGIRATDSHQQDREPYRSLYDRQRLPRVRYGPDVEDLDAAAAVAKYRPQVVVGAWVTHLYDPAQHAAGGNEGGVDELALLDRVDAYVLIGNRKVHAAKPVWARPHTVIEPPWVVSRAVNGSPDFVAVFTRDGDTYDLGWS